LGLKHTYYKEKHKSLIFASKESGIEVNVDKTKCMTVCRDQNAVRSYSIKTDIISFERVEEIKNSGIKFYSGIN
jgi:hypothetical protein